MATIEVVDIDALIEAEIIAEVGDVLVMPGVKFHYVIDRSAERTLVGQTEDGEPVYSWCRGYWDTSVHHEVKS